MESLVTLVIVILAFAVLTASNYFLSRSLLYPPALLSALWSGLLFALLLSEGTFYPVSFRTLLIFALGAMAFSAGGLLALRPSQQAVLPSARNHYIGRVLDIGLIILVLGLPLYWRHIAEISYESGYSDFWQGVRMGTIARAEQGLQSLDSVLLENLAVLSIILSLVAVNELAAWKANQLRTYALVVVALVYQLMNAAATGATLLAFSAIGVYWIRSGRLRIRTLIICMTLFCISFSVVGVALNKGATSSDAGIQRNLSSLVELFQWYTLGALVAFDGVVQDPSSVIPNLNISRFFLQTANKFGAQFYVPSLISDYTMISPTKDFNVYTLYFVYYPHYGWLGVAVLMFCVGAVSTWIYKRARRGDPQGAILYGIVFMAILLSAFNEYYFAYLNFWVKTIALTFLLYKLPMRMALPLANARGSVCATEP